MKKLLTIPLTILLLACSSKKTKPEEVPIHKSQRIKNDVIQQSINTNTMDIGYTDSLDIYQISDTLEFPHEGIPEIVILETGTFHNDEVPDNAKSLSWTGLFFRNKEYYFMETSLTLKKVKDEIADEENEITGWEVGTGLKDSCLLLISGFKFPRYGKVSSVKFSQTNIFPDDSLSFDFNGISYTLFVTGNKKKVSNDWYEVSNYKLYLKEKSEGIEKSQLIRATSSFSDAYTSLLWMGDIDGDKKLDLIMDITRHYNNEVKALYLSSKTGIGKLVKYVGAHSITGC